MVTPYYNSYKACLYSHCKFYDYGACVLISKGGHYIVTSKSESYVYNHKKNMAPLCNSLMWVILSPSQGVDPHCKSYECWLHILISKGGSHIYIHKKVAPHYNFYKGGPILQILSIWVPCSKLIL